MNNSAKLGRLLFGVFTVLTLWRVEVSAQDCPSLLPSNLREIGETGTSWGIELRAFLYDVNKYDEVSQSFQNKGYAFGAADMLVQGEIGDNLFWLGEGVIRRWENRNDFSCRFDEEGIYFTLKQAFLEWTPCDFLLRFGRQNLAYGNGLVLNHWFDGGELNWEFGKLKGSFFGGAFAVDVARACQKKEVIEHLACWKNLCSSEWGDMAAFGGTFSARWLGRQHASLMVMRQIAPNPGGLSRSATFASLYLNGSLIKGFSYFGELAMQLPDEISTVMYNGWGGSFLIQKLWKTKLGSLQSRWGVLYGSGQVDYFRRLDRNSHDSMSDELDVDLMVKITEGRRFWLVYSVLNLSADLARTQQIKFETRIVL